MISMQVPSKSETLRVASVAPWDWQTGDIAAASIDLGSEILAGIKGSQDACAGCTQPDCAAASSATSSALTCAM